MIKLQVIGSAGQVVKTFTARNASHAIRLEARIRSTFIPGSSQYIRRPAN
jgi:hypothetical protein